MPRRLSPNESLRGEREMDIETDFDYKKNAFLSSLFTNRLGVL